MAHVCKEVKLARAKVKEAEQVLQRQVLRCNAAELEAKVEAIKDKKSKTYTEAWKKYVKAYVAYTDSFAKASFP